MPPARPARVSGPVPEPRRRRTVEPKPPLLALAVAGLASNRGVRPRDQRPIERLGFEPQQVQGKAFNEYHN